VIEFLVYLIVLCIVFGLLYYVVTLLPLPEPFKTIAIVLVLVVFILVLLGVLFGGINLPKLKVSLNEPGGWHVSERTYG
jgi:hypothetical protein